MHSQDIAAAITAVAAWLCAEFAGRCSKGDADVPATYVLRGFGALFVIATVALWRGCSG